VPWCSLLAAEDQTGTAAFLENGMAFLGTLPDEIESMASSLNVASLGDRGGGESMDE